MKWTRHLLLSDLIWFVVMFLVFLDLRWQNSITGSLHWMGVSLWMGLWSTRIYLFHQRESPPEGWVYWLHMGMSRTGLLFAFSGGWALAGFLLLVFMLPPVSGVEGLSLLFGGLYGIVIFLSWWNFGLSGLIAFFYVPIFLITPLFLFIPRLESYGISAFLSDNSILVLTVLSGLLTLLAVWLYLRWLKKDLT